MPLLIEKLAKNIFTDDQMETIGPKLKQFSKVILRNVIAASYWSPGGDECRDNISFHFQFDQETMDFKCERNDVRK